MHSCATSYSVQTWDFSAPAELFAPMYDILPYQFPAQPDFSHGLFTAHPEQLAMHQTLMFSGPHWRQQLDWNTSDSPELLNINAWVKSVLKELHWSWDRACWSETAYLAQTWHNSLALKARETLYTQHLEACGSTLEQIGGLFIIFSVTKLTHEFWSAQNCKCTLPSTPVIYTSSKSVWLRSHTEHHLKRATISSSWQSEPDHLLTIPVTPEQQRRTKMLFSFWTSSFCSR